MQLSQLSVTSFRSHSSTTLRPAPRVNLLHGTNGAGKTNVLEAISYLGLGKSFLGAADAAVLQRDADFFVVEGVFEGENRGRQTLRVASVPGEGRRAFANGAPLERLSEVVGRVPLVIVSPADYDLTAGGPSERRQFLDVTLSQSYPVYLDDLIKYRRALKQKSALLHRTRRLSPSDRAAVEAWNNEIATIGGRVVERRRTFLSRFAGLLAEAFELLGAPGQAPSFRYQPAGSGDLEGGAEASIRAALERTFDRSVQTGQTYVGPHRDEVVFSIGDLEVRPYASQGQHRTFSLSLRIAQALYLHESTEEQPLILLDDVFGPLDPERTRVVLDLLESGRIGQSFVTSAQPGPIQETVSFEADLHTMFHVEHGAIVP